MKFSLWLLAVSVPLSTALPLGLKQYFFNLLVDIRSSDPFPVDPTFSDNVNKTTLDSWLADEYDVAWNNLLRNIGNSSTCLDPNIFPGVIVASPSKVKPDYYYQWTRDSSLTIRTLIHYLQDSVNKSDSDPRFQEYQWLVENYIWNNFHLQRLPTMSGDFDSGNTLGEPKYLVNNSQFNQNWGRPQNDGPGLRISSILSFVSLELPSQTGLNTTFIFNEIIKPDLLFVANNWMKESFDLWEEIKSLHFFTSSVQLKGLLDGIQFINSNSYLNVDQEVVDTLVTNYKDLKKFIESYYISTKTNYVLESPALFPHTRSGLDSAVLLGAIHSHDMNENDKLIPFDIDSNHILNHLVKIAGDMKSRYPINHHLDFSNAVGIGRYPEDVYDGYGTSEGNPWFISTATAAELLYKFAYKLVTAKEDLIITAANKDFFKLVLQLDDTQDFVVIKYKSAVFNDLIENLLKFSDNFLVVVKDHVDLKGGVSEQFNKYHGFMEGARDLTWSYSSLLNAFRWRGKVMKLVT
ncbi:Glucoamylase, intracellular sporulation-specific [Yamadazyma tenuis]|uniref:glucan 1,4-alpha-glucosidase n=1 Tax=Candida tenuis (strain ATCC 10573 / BCRC 21748 / CBS 615 / JCM 9827 / NBRC 10315 / NRRL Y-1498 / VKM Y-70) TaxID=590646 RepID=G3BAE2_CANTC|nr:Six-hairpin glycosidase [Yamadazyma tenuis ATCC 10573]XP_006688925.1 uncharacterized protein CANTEDRAFT_115498 [Yamadazyma tenuis ATCC 10573]EGV62754.1 Six-hairpin glycosidase [Yamadazyma tenuis ATCC 10573]EGV62755.1 hypothetical protein CANTEDRAFT_115498 [Yamadazyma tenuis ATCC 10573]WEJ93286.1 Glucoamylase, intracellular sporulation-specific [Yamadazyma tenuis]